MLDKVIENIFCASVVAITIIGLSAIEFLIECIVK